MYFSGLLSVSTEGSGVMVPNRTVPGVSKMSASCQGHITPAAQMLSDTWIVHPKNPTTRLPLCTMSQPWPFHWGRLQYVHTYCITSPAGAHWGSDVDGCIRLSKVVKTCQSVSCSMQSNCGSAVTESSLQEQAHVHMCLNESTCLPCTVTCYLQKGDTQHFILISRIPFLSHMCNFLEATIFHRKKTSSGILKKSTYPSVCMNLINANFFVSWPSRF